MPDNSQSGGYQVTESDADHTLLGMMAIRRDADHAKFETHPICVIYIT